MSELSQAHPSPRLRSLICPPVNPQTQELLATQGLELTYNARGALLTAFEEIYSSDHAADARQILVPAFHCPSAITPALMAGLEPVFYRIRPDLSIDWEDVHAKATPTVTAILVIHFFGAAPDLAPLASLRRRGMRVIEDCSHAFVSVNPMVLAGAADSDYRIFSFWKLTPSGVGGGLLRAEGNEGYRAKRPQAPLKDRLRNFKSLFEEGVEQSSILGLRTCVNAIESARKVLKPRQLQTASRPPRLESGEAYYPVDLTLARASMPAHVRRAIEACDLAHIAQRRRDNFMHYKGHLERLAPMTPLIPDLDEHTCPWVYPVRLPHRDALDRQLRDAGMALHTFGIYLHSKLFELADPQAVADAKSLAQSTLCLSIHQDISLQQIDQGCLAAERILRNQ